MRRQSASLIVVLPTLGISLCVSILNIPVINFAMCENSFLVLFFLFLFLFPFLPPSPCPYPLLETVSLTN